MPELYAAPAAPSIGPDARQNSIVPLSSAARAGSAGSPVAGILFQIAVRGLLVDVLLLVVAMSLGCIEWHARFAAHAGVAAILVGYGLDMFRHETAPSF